MATLKDAVESLQVGSAWDERSFVTPLIHPPSGPLLRALNELAEGESWLVEPRIDAHNPALVSPGVKLGIAPNGFMHTTELFGPVLAVLRADSLQHAIELANAPGYGLTAGLASLDEGEQALFVDTVRAGNVYVNRTITGAIVQRQPFGGFGKSGFGPGAKAGGPNYVLQLCHVRTRAVAQEVASTLPAPVEQQLARFRPLLSPYEGERLARCLAEYAHAEQSHLARAHDFAQVLGQDNVFRYRPAPRVVLRVERDAAAYDVAASCLAALLVGCQLDISAAPGFDELAEPARWGHPAHEEELAALARRVPEAARIRLLGSRSLALDRLSAQLGAHIADAPLLQSGRVELLHYVQEQSVSSDYHRYGNLGIRGLLAARDS